MQSSDTTLLNDVNSHAAREGIEKAKEAAALAIHALGVVQLGLQGRGQYTQTQSFGYCMAPAPTQRSPLGRMLLRFSDNTQYHMSQTKAALQLSPTHPSQQAHCTSQLEGSLTVGTFLEPSLSITFSLASSLSA